ncbi:hypothetical protein ACHAQH_007489 [Verticillium albo-atrum]
METSSVDDDPIVASYNLLLNPALPQGRKLWVLQQPNTTNPDQAPPTEMRLKSMAGMVEIDVPLDYQRGYDRDKGMHWGRHLKNSLVSKNGGTHGLSGGFGVGAAPPRQKKRHDDRDEDLFLDWSEAVRQDKVLRTQTMGGTCPDSKEVQYMIGVFQGGASGFYPSLPFERLLTSRFPEDVHLTPVSNLVHLRPQLHHIDAVTYQERNSSAAASKENGAAAGSSASAAKAIHMTIKQSGDGSAVQSDTMLDRLRSVQSEHWRKLKYTDENDEAAWEVYNESLHLRDESAKKRADVAAEQDLDDDLDMDDNSENGAKDKGKGKASEADGAEGEAASSAVEALSIADNASKLGTDWKDDDLLEAVSGIVKPKPVSKEEQKQAAEEAAAAQAAAEAAAKARPRARGGAAARGRGRGRGATTRGA